MKVEEKDKLVIRQFKDSSSNWWVHNKHYHLDASGELKLICGGLYDEKEEAEVKAYIKRNKKVYKPREKSVLDQEEKVYREVFTFGKYSGKKVDEVVNLDRKYLQWCLKNLNFAGKGKLKEEITEILKL